MLRLGGNAKDLGAQLSMVNLQPGRCCIGAMMANWRSIHPLPTRACRARRDGLPQLVSRIGPPARDRH